MLSIEVPQTDVYAFYDALERDDWQFEEGHCGHPLRGTPAIKPNACTQLRTTKQPAEVATAKRKLKVIVSVLLIALFVGMRSTKGAPAIPRLIGVAVSVSLISLCVFLLLKARKLS